MFEKASRIKLRFKSIKGLITVEELWDLALQPDLDNLAKNSYQRLQSSVQSFVTKKNAEDTKEQLRLDILKHVIGVKVAEKEAKQNAVSRKIQKERILDIIDAKKDESLQSKSVEELKSMLNEL